MRMLAVDRFNAKASFKLLLCLSFPSILLFIYLNRCICSPNRSKEKEIKRLNAPNYYRHSRNTHENVLQSEQKKNVTQTKLRTTNPIIAYPVQAQEAVLPPGTQAAETRAAPAEARACQAYRGSSAAGDRKSVV